MPGLSSASQSDTQNRGSSADGAGLSNYSLLASSNSMQCIEKFHGSLRKSMLADEKRSRVYWNFAYLSCPPLGSSSAFPLWSGSGCCTRQSRISGCIAKEKHNSHT